MNKQLLNIGICIGLFILFRYLYSIAGVKDVDFLLWPVDKIISMSLDSTSEFIPEKGYYHPTLKIVIEKSCSGGNFFLLSFFMTCFIFITNKADRFFLILTGSLLFSYLLTLIANVGRITGYLLVRQNYLRDISPDNEAFFHTAIGIVIYLTFLIAYYILLNQYVLNKKMNVHEEVA